MKLVVKSITATVRLTQLCLCVFETLQWTVFISFSVSAQLQDHDCCDV